MTREEKIQILSDAISGLIAANPNHMIGEEGCGDAAFAIVDGAFEILSAVQYAESINLFEDQALLEFQKNGSRLQKVAYGNIF